jgi:hypothetical protein
MVTRMTFFAWFGTTGERGYSIIESPRSWRRTACANGPYIAAAKTC